MVAIVVILSVGILKLGGVSYVFGWLMKRTDMATNKDCVIVVHGFGGKRLWMWPLANRLRRDFDVLNWSYFSFAGSVQRHAERLSARLVETASQDTSRKIHLVAHSMGSIVARAAIAKEMPANFGRLVLLAPPNSGSPVARIASKGFGWACQPLSDLSDDPNSYVNSMPAHCGPPTAVIAARYDLLVPRESAKLDGSKQHTELSATHNSLLFSPRVGKIVTKFLDPTAACDAG